MTKAFATITDEYAIPIPDEIGDHLGVGAGGQVELTVEDDGTITVRPRQFREFTLEETFGSVPAIPGMSHDFDREIEEAISDAMDEKYARLAKQRQS